MNCIRFDPGASGCIRGFGGILGGIRPTPPEAIPPNRTLSDLAIRNAKPQEKPIELTDGGGLYLLVNPTGSHPRRRKYRFLVREKILAIGAYPTVSLAKARGARDDARVLLADGVDPSAHERDARREAALVAANTFAVLADEHLDEMRLEGEAKSTISRLAWLLGLARGELGGRP